MLGQHTRHGLAWYIGGLRFTNVQWKLVIINGLCSSVSDVRRPIYLPYAKCASKGVTLLVLSNKRGYVGRRPTSHYQAIRFYIRRRLRALYFILSAPA
jgi:hypothetical protein